MAYCFGVVEEKLQEAEFFLGLLGGAARHSFAGRCYFSAFVSAARSVTFALQFSMNGIDGFAEWYASAQEVLRADPLAPHFVEIRNDLQKKGLNCLDEVPVSHLPEHLLQQFTGESRAPVLLVPSGGRGSSPMLTDALEASRSYFRLLVSLVFDAYVGFKTSVDPRWYYTQAHFEALHQTLEDALAELGVPPDWTAGAPRPADAWRALRAQQPPCALNEVFERHPGKRVVDPHGAT